MIKVFKEYIKENNSFDDVFKIGDRVIVNGNVDGKKFNNIKDSIKDIGKGGLIIGNNENDLYKKNYYGVIYELFYNNWWVSPHNLKKTEVERTYSESDPYGEENWDE